VNTQPTLFHELPLPVQPLTDAPRCRMCPRPARWNTVREQWGMYCSSSACTNRTRICQSCRSEFLMNVDGAGTKYCSLDCKHDGYTAAYRTKRAVTLCAWCSEAAPTGTRAGHRGGGWPYICRPCTEPIRHLLDRLRNHRVPHQRARKLLDEPSCEVCGIDIVTKVKDGRGNPRARLVVDHDHNCCAGEKSCGQCVRGLICSTCNTAAGLMRDDPRLARSLADYMERAA
jgi:hypothetical protein